MKPVSLRTTLLSFHISVTTLIFIVFVNITNISNANANTQTDPLTNWLKQATLTVKKQEALLKKSTLRNTNIGTLSNYLKDINIIKSKSQECIANTETQLLKATEDLKTLGEPAKKESKEVRIKRSSLSTLQKDFDKQLSTCKLLQLQSQDLIKAINELQQSILAQRLFAETDNIFTVLTDNLKTPAAGWKDSIE